MASVLTASLALSLLKHSCPLNESFVLSPYSLNIGLAIIHDGAGGNTQKELTNLLLNGESQAKVTDYYSSLALSAPSTTASGAAFNTATRLYVDKSISLKADFQKHVESKYKVKAMNISFAQQSAATSETNQFVDSATNGKIKNVAKPPGFSVDTKAVLINAIHFAGKWKYPFNPTSTHTRPFNGVNGVREVQFMNHYDKNVRVNKYEGSDIGNIVILPYKNEDYNFFFLMPHEEMSFEELRNIISGTNLAKILQNSQPKRFDITVPKFTLESTLDGADVLKKLGVKSLFEETADFSKISSTPLKISKIQHNAMIEVNEEGTEAGASTLVEAVTEMARPHIVIDRSFLYGIVKSDQHILFLGQYV